jgi:hypothetical protein
MARTFGFDSATSFALVVEGWTTEQRRGSLERFYRLRREKMEADEEAERMRELMERGRRMREEREKAERERGLERVAEDTEDGEEGATMDVDWEGATRDTQKAYLQSERDGAINEGDKASTRMFREGALKAIDEAGSEALNQPTSHKHARTAPSEVDDKMQGMGIGPESLTSSEDEDDQL